MPVIHRAREESRDRDDDARGAAPSWVSRKTHSTGLAAKAMPAILRMGSRDDASLTTTEGRRMKSARTDREARGMV